MLFTRYIHSGRHQTQSGGTVSAKCKVGSARVQEVIARRDDRQVDRVPARASAQREAPPACSARHRSKRRGHSARIRALHEAARGTPRRLAACPGRYPGRRAKRRPGVTSARPKPESTSLWPEHARRCGQRGQERGGAHATLRGSDLRKDMAPQPLPSTTTRGLPVPRLLLLVYRGRSSAGGTPFSLLCGAALVASGLCARSFLHVASGACPAAVFQSAEASWSTARHAACSLGWRRSSQVHVPRASWHIVPGAC